MSSSLLFIILMHCCLCFANISLVHSSEMTDGRIQEKAKQRFSIKRWTHLQRTRMLIDFYSSLKTWKSTLHEKANMELKVCYKRFKMCSAHLSSTFCAFRNNNFSFYIWAHRLANDILQGKRYSDGNSSHIKCPAELVTQFHKVS